MLKIALIGAGGHAKVVYEALVANGKTNIHVYDNAPDLKGEQFLDTTIIGPYDGSADAIHIAIGDNEIRASIAKQYAQPLYNVIHPDATLSSSAELGEGIFIAAQAVVGPEAKVGNGVIINHGAVIDHDCCVDDWSHIAPNATLGGKVKIGDYCLVGAGSTILPGLFVASRNIIGGAAIVTKRIDDSHQKIKGVA